MIDKTTPPGTNEFTTVIGADATLKGELTFEKAVRVDGKVEGKIVTKGQLAISQGGKVQAEVQAGSVIVEGDVIGNLHASDRIELRRSARLRGDLRASKLLVAEGASFVGQCHVGPEAGSAPHAAPPPPVNRIAEPQGQIRK